MAVKIFITGTDTGVGKTHISVGLLKYFAKQGLSTIGLKPIASGVSEHSNGFYNDDALALQQAATQQLPYHVVNPFLFKEPIAPHIAAQRAGYDLTLEKVVRKLEKTFSNYSADVYVIEGAGGWYVPLNNRELYSQVAIELALPVILVVGIRLGCLNHALLSERAIVGGHVSMIGWIANVIDPHMEVVEENIQTLRDMIVVPCLDVVGYGQDICLNINTSTYQP